MNWLRRNLAPFRRDRTGVSAVEFALIAPIMLTLFFGGYVFCETVSINRKITITTRALADLTSQYAIMATSDMNTVLGASTQIIAPYDPTPLTIKVSEIKVDLLGNATVQWCAPVSACSTYVPGPWYTQPAGAPYVQGTSYTLPVGTAIPGSYYVISEVSYKYTPPALYNIIQSFNLSDRIIMVPRLSTYVTYNGSGS